MQIEFKPPEARIPGYTPIVIPPSDLEAPEGVEKETTEEAPVAPKMQIPVLDIQMPLPTTEVVMTATYAAVAAVATTTLATPFFDQIKKNLALIHSTQCSSKALAKLLHSGFSLRI